MVLLRASQNADHTRTRNSGPGPNCEVVLRNSLALPRALDLFAAA